MKKFGLMMIMSLAVACGDDKKDGPAQDKCSTEQDGDQKCVDNVIFTCNGSVYEETETCTTEEPCQQIGTALRYNCAPAVPPVDEFEECDPDVNNCNEGQRCEEQLEDVLGFAACITDCDPTAETDECGDGRICLAFSATAGICFNQDAERDEPCLYNGSWCADGLDCVATSQLDRPALECKEKCDIADIGTQGDCGVDELCLENPAGSWDFEYTTENDPNAFQLDEGGTQFGIECDVTEEVSTTCGDNFFCAEFTLTAGGNIGLCIGFETWCAVEADILGSIDLADIEASNFCGQPAASQACGTLTGSDELVDDAQVSCLQISAPYDYDDSFECSDDSECAPGYECVTFQDGSFCTLWAQACIALCEGEDEADLDCGTGRECTQPATFADSPVGYVIIQPSAAPEGECDSNTDCTTAHGAGAVCFSGSCYITCDDTEADCDTTNGYACEELTLGFVCSRAPKMCTDVVAP